LQKKLFWDYKKNQHKNPRKKLISGKRPGNDKNSNQHGAPGCVNELGEKGPDLIKKKSGKLKIKERRPAA